MINDYQLKITGAASLGQELEADKRVKITTELEINEVTKKDNKDGSFDLIYKAEICSNIEVQQGEKVWRGKDTKTYSKKLRGAVWHLQSSEGVEQDQEQFYAWVMKGVIAYLPEIYQFLKTKNK